MTHQKSRTVHVVRARFGQGQAWFHQKRDAMEHVRAGGGIYAGTKKVPRRSKMKDWAHAIAIYGTELRHEQRRHAKRTRARRSR